MEPSAKNHGTDGSMPGEPSPLPIMIAGVLKTAESRRMLGDIVQDIMRTWAGENRLKKKVSGRAESLILKKWLGPVNGNGDKTVSALLGDPAFLSGMIRLTPEALGVMIEGLNAEITHLSSLSDQERQRFLSDFLSRLGQVRAGELATELLRIVNMSYTNNPRYLSEHLGSALVSWLEDLDLGEIREFADKSKDDLALLVTSLVGVLEKYPSKLVIFLGFIADAVNVATFTTSEVMTMINKISPDLLTDVAFSVFRQVDGKSVGRFLNQVSELVRKLHTGSALLGEPGTTQLPMDLTGFLNDMLSVLDGDLMWKAKIAFEEEKEIITRVFYQVMKDNPERLERRMTRYSSLKNAQIRSLLHHVSTLGKLPEMAVADAMEKGISAVETQDLADVINQSFALVNRISTLKPELFPQLVTQFVDALDLYDAHDSLEWFFESVCESLIPLERVVAPKLVKHLCRVLEPRNDDYDEEMAEARMMLRSLLINEEVDA